MNTPLYQNGESVPVTLEVDPDKDRINVGQQKHREEIRYI